MSIARAMNGGDLGLAGILSSRLPIPNFDIDGLAKAATDDPKHPGYPAHEPDSKGGQFRTKNTAGADGGDQARCSIDGPQQGQKVRMVGETTRIASGAGPDPDVQAGCAARGRKPSRGGHRGGVPIVDGVTDGIALADDVALASAYIGDRLEYKVAFDFAKDGPSALEDLLATKDERSFSSFEDFKKVDLIGKVYGSAGDGMDYHHIVEQAAVGDEIPAAEVQATGNIVKIPRVFHERINSICATPQVIDGEMIAPRAFLKGKSFQERYDFGIRILKEVGVIY